MAPTPSQPASDRPQARPLTRALARRLPDSTFAQTFGKVSLATSRKHARDVVDQANPNANRRARQKTMGRILVRQLLRGTQKVRTSDPWTGRKRRRTPRSRTSSKAARAMEQQQDDDIEIQRSPAATPAPADADSHEIQNNVNDEDFAIPDTQPGAGAPTPSARKPANGDRQLKHLSHLHETLHSTALSQEATILTLQNQLADAQTTTAAQGASFDSLNAELAAEKAQNANLTAQNGKLTQQTADLIHQLSATGAARTSASATIAHLEAEYSNLHTDHLMLNTDLYVSQHMLAEQQTEIRTQGSLAKRLGAQFTDHDVQLMATTAELAGSNAANIFLGIQLQERETELYHMNAHASDQEAKIGNLGSRLEGSEARLAVRNDENADLASRLQTAEAQLAARNEEFAAQGEKYRKMTAHLGRCKALHAGSIATLEAVLGDLKGVEEEPVDDSGFVDESS